MPKGVRHARYATPTVRLDPAFEAGAGGNGTRHGAADVGNDKVEVDWRPMPGIVARPLNRRGRTESRRP